MASAVTVQHIGARDKLTCAPHVPNSTAATYWTPNQGTTFEWLDMTDFEWFGVIAANAVLTGNGLTELDIFAAPAANSTNAQSIVASGALTGTAVGNGAFVEIEAAQLREIGASSGFSLRYVTAKITVNNAADDLAVCAVRSLAKHPQLNLTPATF